MKIDNTPVVLVTGAAKRIGEAVSLHMAKRGWRVAVHYRYSREEAQATSADCSSHTDGSHIFCADLSVEAESEALVPSIISRMGRLDAIVNNASIFEYDNIESMSYAKLQAHMLANVAGPLKLMQAMGRYAKENRPHPSSRLPVVVNVLDQKLWNPNPDFLTYTLSKAALESATQLAAQALAPLVRVVGVALGATLNWMDDPRADDFAKRVQSSMLLNRVSHIEDVVATIAFVIENQSITGNTIIVDAGQHLGGRSCDPYFMPDPSNPTK